MSRIGHLPVEIPEKVDVSITEDNVLTVEGPKGSLTQDLNPRMDIKVDDDEVVVNRPTESKDDKSAHGLTRSLIVNMIEGVTTGFKKELEINGVGYRAVKQGNKLEIQAGYSHPVVVEPEGDIEFTVEDGNIIVEGVDKQLVGQVAADIRQIRKPEPYNGKGIKYADERIRRKEGKTS
ncbi:50S ribosomal protein L6 [Halanaerobacter jeridensis]|uniref:Large ribosomal subunit protein uL6 n=1 Tax=Halanaerobacter jeridensis TaxID=706427 RepID=A0A938XQ85_9FIRM|nr:50S ribosomal protein L6 [Halanaerobacter jeridensis]MBM7557818.1 large subunit ribosomal protein L6 [Halanaerobacter jeridensis]